MLKVAQRKQYAKHEQSAPLAAGRQQALDKFLFSRNCSDESISRQNQSLSDYYCLQFQQKNHRMQGFSNIIQAKTLQSDRNSHKSPQKLLEKRPSLELAHLLSPIIIKQEEQQPNNNPSNPQSKAISLGSLSRISQKSSKQWQQSSSNHNFQKHTVVTIKKLTRTLGTSLGSSPAELVAQQMWNIFLASGVKSKRMLVVLFGCAQLQEQKYKDLLKGCFFGELCNYDQTVVRAAQQVLRQKVVSMLTPDAVREDIERNRHIKKRDNFYAYFMEFTEMLRNGPLVKFRISSMASQRILDRVQTSASLQAFSKPRKRASRRVTSLKKIS